MTTPLDLVRCESPHCRYPHCACADVQQGGWLKRRDVTLACLAFVSGVVLALVIGWPA